MDKQLITNIGKALIWIAHKISILIFIGIMLFFAWIFYDVVGRHILKWFINNGLRGIWNFIVNILKFIWCGKGC